MRVHEYKRPVKSLLLLQPVCEQRKKYKRRCSKRTTVVPSDPSSVIHYTIALCLILNDDQDHVSSIDLLQAEQSGPVGPEMVS